MTRAGRIGYALVSLVLVAGIAYYSWPTQAPQQQQQGKKGKGKRGGGGDATEAVPVLTIDARITDAPVYPDGVGTATALNTVTVRPQVEGKLLPISFTDAE